MKPGRNAFLHAFADKAPAIRLYEILGFAIRTEIGVQVFAAEA